MNQPIDPCSRWSKRRYTSTRKAAWDEIHSTKAATPERRSEAGRE
jgi:hypothetical protein